MTLHLDCLGIAFCVGCEICFCAKETHIECLEKVSLPKNERSLFRLRPCECQVNRHEIGYFHQEYHNSCIKICQITRQSQPKTLFTPVESESSANAIWQYIDVCAGVNQPCGMNRRSLMENVHCQNRAWCDLSKRIAYFRVRN